MTTFDLLVIGGGWGGYTAALTFAEGGGRVGLVEMDKVGGVCLHRGCIPTKALLETANAFRSASDAERLGVQVGAAQLDWPQALENRDAIVARLMAGMEQALATANVERLNGAGTLDGERSVQVKPRRGKATRVSGEALVIATGSEPATLPFLPVDGRRVITSDEALSIAPPKRAIIVGGGAVGMEFASLWTDLGSEVTVLEALPSILPQEDRDISRVVMRALRERGATIETGVTIDPSSVKVTSRSVRMEYDLEDERRTARGDVVLVATGRTPRTSALKLDAGGISSGGAAVRVDASMATSAAGVYAVGDVTGGLQLAHVAAAQGRAVAQRLLGKDAATIAAVDMPRAVYTTPEVASIGLTEQEAKADGRRVQVGRARFSINARALIHGDADGLVKIVADAASGDVLGGHIVGAGATEMIGQLSVARFLNASMWEVATAVQPHPTLSEAVSEAAQAALRPRRRMGGKTAGAQ
jgi:dihydrolipoamide dehydrogenase